jgi:hypothetical protein
MSTDTRKSWSHMPRTDHIEICGPIRNCLPARDSSSTRALEYEAMYYTERQAPDLQHAFRKVVARSLGSYGGRRTCQGATISKAKMSELRAADMPT